MSDDGAAGRTGAESAAEFAAELSAGAVAAELSRRRFDGDFRSYQQLALQPQPTADQPTSDQSTADQSAAGQPAADQTRYVVMPPGAGKTLVGLELARRAGRRTLVLVPNTAVLGQWAASWDTLFPVAPGVDDPHGGGIATPCATDRSLDAPLTVLTYQSLAVIDEGRSAHDRRAAVRGGSRTALLDLLHPNGRDLVARAAARGPWTLVLDECHHLLDTWGALVRAFVDELGPDTTVIGLTATPPRLLTGWQRELHDDLFGTADVEIPAPALVRDGDLAPYQELVYLTAPTPEEDSWLATEAARFADLQVELVDRRLGTIPLVDWLQRRTGDRTVTGRPGELASGGALSWGAFERAEPDLARAAVRFAVAGLLPLPDGARVREEHRAGPGAADWVTVLADFCTGHLQRSADPADATALAAIRRVLPGLGYRLTSAGIRATTSPVDRMCGLSEAKSAAAIHLLGVEAESLGADLRALVLCDFETASGRLPSGLAEAGADAGAGSARLVFSSCAAADVGGPGGLRPLLVTGSVFACPAAGSAELVEFCRAAGYAVSAAPLDGVPQLHAITGGTAFTPRRWVRIATDYFAAGRALVLIGTRALLGEGWDCAAVNVSVDLTTAATPTAVTQMRGRSLRLDPARPDKLADNWTVCCATADHPRGDADYQRLVRKHAAYFGTTADGEIESGISHCDPALSPYAPPADADFAAVTARALARVADRSGARARWRLGEPYAGVEVATVRIRADRAIGADAIGLAPAALVPAGRTPIRSGGRSAGVLGAGTAAGTIAGLLGGVPAGAATGAGVAVAGAAAVIGIPALRWARGARPGESGALERLAAAVADGMHAAGGLSAGAAELAFEPTSDGWVRCSLGGVPPAEAQRFATGLDELLAPLAEPRQLVGRMVVLPPPSLVGRLRYAARAAAGFGLDAAVAWHAVPSWCAGGSRRLRAFLTAWEGNVGPARSVAADSAEGQAILELFRGEDPFAITTQLRTLWR